jgi:hypothetical protein
MCRSTRFMPRPIKSVRVPNFEIALKLSPSDVESPNHLFSTDGGRILHIDSFVVAGGLEEAARKSSRFECR